MNVKNRGYIRKLSLKVVLSAPKRNLITIVAIALTTLMFTSLFTIALSINATYQNYMFKQVGGYVHGAFKEVNKEQIEKISKHPKIKACGDRTVIGRITEGGFAQNPGEVSYMADNQAVWSYAVPTQGRFPKNGKEIAMDTGALELLGYEPILNSEITLTYEIDNKGTQGEKRLVTDTFTLAGFWEYDSFMPAHYLNISKEYCDSVVGDDDFRTDLNVMLYRFMNIEKQLESIKEDLGYVDDKDVRIGLIAGYGVGAILTPLAIKNTTFGLKLMTRSNSPWIFVFAILLFIRWHLQTLEEIRKRQCLSLFRCLFPLYY